MLRYVDSKFLLLTINWVNIRHFFQGHNLRYTSNFICSQIVTAYLEVLRYALSI
ncbi:hypothetical protein B0I21_105398 [Sphingobacterium paludis]|uniref:Uncharacterized protein n=1 Tax=Sphingobacterium paludis TaxID=1476465 RepID=A0A4R7CZB4_9SPHI|nr:hypothetical protein B0I21_105398 [Sphingobacterium paludis]